LLDWFDKFKTLMKKNDGERGRPKMAVHQMDAQKAQPGSKSSVSNGRQDRMWTDLSRQNFTI